MKIYARFICSFALILALLVCGLHGTADAKYQVGETQSYRVEISAAGGNDTAIIQREGATFIKVHLEALSLVGSDTLRLFDADGTLQSTYDSSSNGSLWIPSVEGDAATIVLNAPEGSASRAVIDEFGWGFGETEMLSANGYVADSLIIESTCGTDDKRDRECHRGTYRYNEAGSVGRLRFRDDDTGGFFLCTGFLVSYQDHFITNNHCIDTTTEAASAEARFNYEYTSCGGSTLKSWDQFNGSTLVWTSTGLDATLIIINGDPAATYGYLPLSGRVLQRNDPIYLPQHPAGLPKKIVATNNGSLWATVPTPLTSESGYTTNSSFLHNADTLGGSSGSPVLDTQNYVIGLHHTGYASPPYSCTILHPAHPTGNPADGYNGAILMSRILPQIAGFLPADILQRASGSCPGCSGWRWSRVREAWRYTSGAAERMWAYFQTASPNYIWTDAKADRLRSRMIVEGAGSGHWLGTYWWSSNSWSNIRLWYN